MSRFDGLPLTLRNLRLAAGLTGIEVAKKLGTKNSSISRWETGKEVPGLKSLGKLLDLYEVTLADFDDALAVTQGRPLVQRPPRLPKNEGEVETCLDALLGPTEPEPTASCQGPDPALVRATLGPLLLAAGRLAAAASAGAPPLPPVRKPRRRKAASDKAAD